MAWGPSLNLFCNFQFKKVILSVLNTVLKHVQEHLQRKDRNQRGVYMDASISACPWSSHFFLSRVFGLKWGGWHCKNGKTLTSCMECGNLDPNQTIFLHKKAFYYSCGLTGHMVHPTLMWTIFLYFWICLEYNPMHISCSFKNWITVSPFSLTYFNVGTHSIELLNVTLNRKRVYTLSLFGFITFSQ